MQDSVKFAKRIPGFSDLLPEDRMILVQSGCFEVSKKSFNSQFFFNRKIRKTYNTRILFKIQI